MFEGKTHTDAVRVWVPACATGEEAYSIAMLLHEYARNLDPPPAIQVLMRPPRRGHPGGAGWTLSGCDRRGCFGRTAAHFFPRDVRGYRVRREVREVVLFAAHDLLKDAPFSRMDLVSCRNLLIYLDPSAQSGRSISFTLRCDQAGACFLACPN